MVKYAQRISTISVISVGIAIISNTILGYEAWEAFLLALSLTAASGINSIKEYYMIQSYADKYSTRQYFIYQLSMGALISLVSIPAAQLILQGMAGQTVKPKLVLIELFIIYLFFQEILDTYLKLANVRFYKREQGTFFQIPNINRVFLIPSIFGSLSAYTSSTQGPRIHVKAYWKKVLQLSTGKGILAIFLSLIVRYPFSTSQAIWYSVLFGIAYMSYALCQIGKDYTIVEATTGKISRKTTGKVWILLSLLKAAIAGPMAALVAGELHFDPSIGLPAELIHFLNANIGSISAVAFAFYTLIDQLLNNKKQAAKFDLVTDEVYAAKTIALFFEPEEALKYRTYVKKPDGTFYVGKHS